MHPFVQIPIGAGLGLVLLLLAGAWFAFAARFGAQKARRLAALPALVGLGLIVAQFARGGPLTVFYWPTYGIMLLIGALAVTGAGMRWARQRGLRPDLIVELALLALIFGLIGARAVHVVEQWDARFADRPAAVRLGTPRSAFATGDRLRLETSQGSVEVRFEAGALTPAAVVEAINRQAKSIGVEAEVVKIEHRGVAAIQSYPRGLVLRTTRRGPEALLRIHGGAAAQRFAPRLVKDRAVEVHGEAVPLTRVFDLSSGGLTYFGSVVGILLSGGLWLRYRKVQLLVVGDVMAPALPLGLFFGRLGCTAFGCCWGREQSDMPWRGFRFPPGSPSWRQLAEERLSCEFDPLLDAIAHHSLHQRGASVETVLKEAVAETPAFSRLAQEALPRLQDIAEGTPPLHPAQLYEGLGVLLVVLALWLYRERLQKRLGQCFALLFLLQAPLRFAVEHVRRDHDVFFHLPGLDYAFTESQVVALILFGGALPVFAWFTARGEPISTEPAPPPEDPLPADADEAPAGPPLDPASDPPPAETAPDDAGTS